MKKKNSKSADLKKLAMLGLAAGLLMPGQSLQANSNFGDNSNFDHYLASNGCGAHGCNGGSGGTYGYRQNQPYYQSHGCASNQGGWETQNWQTQSGCAHTNPTQQHWQAMNSCNSHQQQNWQAQSGCAHQGSQYQAQGGYNQRGTQQNWQAHSCNSHSPQQNYQAQNSCGAGSGHYYPSFADNTDQSDSQYDSNTNSNSNATKNNGYRSKNEIADSDHGQQGHTATAPQKATILTEKDLMNQLNAQSKAQFQSLSKEGKELALKLANQDCKGKNDCKGQGSCKSAKNDCAGKNGCKGQSIGPFKDKNVAVKVAATKMAEKRNNALKN